MPRTVKRYPVEVRERAVRLVLEHRDEYETKWAAITSVASKFGMSGETLRGWVRQAEVDGGVRPGTTTSYAERIRELERECRELRRANEMADSSGQRNESCEMSQNRSQEDVDGRASRASQRRAE